MTSAMNPMQPAGRSPCLVILGRPNVGKSTLFNRLLGRRRSIVHDLPGVTRDRIEEKASWNVPGAIVDVRMIDTGGLGGETFDEEIRRQVSFALQEADAALVLFDARAGVTPADEEVLRELRRSGIQGKIPVIGVANKVDEESLKATLGEFYTLGLDEVVAVSAEHDLGVEALREDLYERFKQAGFFASAPVDEDGEADTEAPAGPRPPKIPRVAIVGRPNVGKSTLLNAILGKERMITSPMAGTTADSVDVEVELDDRKVVLVDTAGIRRKSKTEKGVEVLSVIQARKALELADVAILVLDGAEGVTDQDEKIAGLVEQSGCAVILALNKWDLHRGLDEEGKQFTREMAAEHIRKKMRFLGYAPLVFMSAKERRGIDGLGELIEDIMFQRKLKIPTHEFTEWIRKESEIHNPWNAKFYLCHQTGSNPPSFTCHVSNPEKIHFSLQRHLVKAMREKWGFMGSPVRLNFVKSSDRRR